MIYLLLGLSYLAASSLVLSVVLAYQEATPDSPPPSTRHHLLASSVCVLSLFLPLLTVDAGSGIPVRAAVPGVLLPLAHLAADGQEVGAEQHPVHLADGGGQQSGDERHYSSATPSGSSTYRPVSGTGRTSTLRPFQPELLAAAWHETPSPPPPTAQSLWGSRGRPSLSAQTVRLPGHPSCPSPFLSFLPWHTSLIPRDCPPESSSCLSETQRPIAAGAGAHLHARLFATENQPQPRTVSTGCQFSGSFSQGSRGQASLPSEPPAT